MLRGRCSRTKETSKTPESPLEEMNKRLRLVSSRARLTMESTDMWIRRYSVAMGRTGKPCPMSSADVASSSGVLWYVPAI
jgi:hypothetical protein